jgi:dTDP-4-dehydrorhamnose reductase
MPVSTLIVGGNGMLGRSINALLSRNPFAQPVTLDLPALDITSGTSVASAFREHAPKLVFHCAAMTDVDGCERGPARAQEVNGEGTRLIAEACKTAGALLVYFSTDFVFDGRENRPYTEEDAPNPLSVYGATKLEGERHAQACPDHLIIRTAWLFGAGRENFITKIIARAKTGGKFTVVDDQFGSPTYTTDLAGGAMALVEKNARGIFHLTNRGSCSRHEFARLIVAKAGLSAEVSPAKTVPAPGIAVRPVHGVLSLEKYESLTGLPLRPWQEAAGDFISRHLKAGGAGA